MIRFKQECEVHINPLKSEYIIDSYKGTPSVLTGIEWVPIQHPLVAWDPHAIFSSVGNDLTTQYTVQTMRNKSILNIQSAALLLAVLMIPLAGCLQEDETNNTVECELVPYGQCSGEDFSGQDLSELNLTGIDLSYANLSGASLTNLNYADLTGANLDSAILDDAELEGAVLTGANLYYASINNGTNLYIADLTSADLTGANLTGAVLHHADFTDAIVTDSDFTDTYWYNTIWTDGVSYNENQA